MQQLIEQGSMVITHESDHCNITLPCLACLCVAQVVVSLRLIVS